MGPWITSADEVDGRDTRVRGWVNGELRQDGRTRDMIFDIATLVETCSRGITLHPGDVIATGTPGGVGIGRSIHAGQVCVADGSELAAQKLERVLTNDPGTGVMRHVDAGYEHAREVARERGVRIPMMEG